METESSVFRCFVWLFQSFTELSLWSTSCFFCLTFNVLYIFWIYVSLVFLLFFSFGQNIYDSLFVFQYLCEPEMWLLQVVKVKQMEKHVIYALTAEALKKTAAGIISIKNHFCYMFYSFYMNIFYLHFCLIIDLQSETNYY